MKMNKHKFNMENYSSILKLYRLITNLKFIYLLKINKGCVSWEKFLSYQVQLLHLLWVCIVVMCF